MNKETRDLTKLGAVRWIYYNNPGKVYVHHYDSMDRPALVISRIPISELQLPEGWYYDENTGITCENPSIFFPCAYDYTVKIALEE